ncbi:uncharacterized protein LOC143465728 [Clavelina lepadiformis]|uniref:uncharacterized protein LOC143465728 n=1 Tax=Clavelina lepadiformis TaxID=159417 RepID=UPI00404338D9
MEKVADKRNDFSNLEPPPYQTKAGPSQSGISQTGQHIGPAKVNYVTQTTVSLPPQSNQPNQITYITQTTTQHGAFEDMYSRIPIMPMCLAVTLCVINTICPGMGTVIASFTIFCCGRVNMTTNSSKCEILCYNFWIGWAQLLTCWLIAGWIWSIMWGYAFIAVSAKYADPQNIFITTTRRTTIPVPAGVEGSSIQT